MVNRVSSLTLLMALCVHWIGSTQVHSKQVQLPRLTPRLRTTLTGHTKAIESVGFSPDGKLVVTVSQDRTVRLWDAYTGEVKGVLSGADQASFEPAKWSHYVLYQKTHDFPDVFPGSLKNVIDNGARLKAISPDQRLLITQRELDPDAFRSRYLMEIWDIARGERKLTFAEVPYVSKVYWSPDGNAIVVSGSNRTQARIMDVRTGGVIAKLPYQSCTADSWFGDSECAPFIFNADGSVFTKEKHLLKLWCTSTGQLLAELKPARPPAQFSPTDVKLLVTRSQDDKTALIWELP